MGRKKEEIENCIIIY